MHSTVWPAFELVVQFDEELNKLFGHEGVLGEELLLRVLKWTIEE